MAKLTSNPFSYDQRAPSRQESHRGPGLPGKAIGAAGCRQKFLSYFPGGFADPKYLSWERGYKWTAHQKWQESLNPERFQDLLSRKKYSTIASLALGIESTTHLLFSFEKMAIRDALRRSEAARTFAIGLHRFLEGSADDPHNFERWCRLVEGLPRKQSRVFTWPVVTVFGFLARPDQHFYFKPTVTRNAVLRYGLELPYQSKPGWSTYGPLLDLVHRVRRDLRDLRPRDMIDLQSFLWVQGSDEYP